MKYYKDTRFCPICKKDTEQICRDSDHERDSSMDFQYCKSCKHEYNGFSGCWELWDDDWEPEADKEIETEKTTATNKKYQTPGIYKLKEMGTTLIVIPFNGEKINQLSWSHGFTHYINVNGNIGCCGQNYFEENATKIPEDLISGTTYIRR